MGTGMVLGGAPLWVYVLLAGLVALGVRRLRTRDVPIAVASIPSIAFLIWSVIGAYGFARWAGAEIATLAWLGGAALGSASAFAAPEPRATILSQGRVRLPGSALPLILYLVVFVARFACGAWAALRPTQTLAATTIGIVIGAAMTGRLVASVSRWRRTDPVVAA